MEGTLLGLSGQQYVIQSHIKSGGEGGVYNIDQPELVAKIYDTSKASIGARLSELEQKVKYMVNHRIPTKCPDGTVILPWPQDMVYKDGKFVGYIMPKISGAKPIYLLNRGGAQADSVIPGYNWKKALIVASNLANIVAFLHSNDIVIGDMNSDNILVYPNGMAAIIDTDSFDLHNREMDQHYKCSVGTEEFLPPELQGRNLAKSGTQYTPYADDFALAIHIFQLLMNNAHPFNARVITDYKQSLAENSQNYNISVGNCPFVRQIAGCEIPAGSPVMSELLPDYLIEDFRHTFDYQLDLNDVGYVDKLKAYMKGRTPASQWRADLKKLSGDRELVSCSVNPKHFYLASKQHCEMCTAKERMDRLLHSSGQAASHSGGPAGSGANGSSVNGSGVNGSYTNGSGVNGGYTNGSGVNGSGRGASGVGGNNGRRYTANKKGGKRKYFAAAAVAAAVIACFAYVPVHNVLTYNSAMDAYNQGNFYSAAEKFEELDDYRDSYDYWIDSMMLYAANHYNNTDKITYQYICELMDLGIDLSEDYDELYSWKIDTGLVNDEKKDHTTEYPYISGTDEWYAHIKIVGGTPGESISVYTARKSGSGSYNVADYNLENGVNSYMASNAYWIDDGSWHFNDPSNVSSGTWTMGVFREDNDQCLGYISIPIRKE